MRLEACSSGTKHVWNVFGPRSTEYRVKANRPPGEPGMSSQPILRCSDHAPSMTRRNVRNFADPYLDEGKPVILQCDERNFPHRCSVVSRDNFMTLKPQDKGGKRVFNEPPQARHRRSLAARNLRVGANQDYPRNDSYFCLFQIR
jgi:hypothetical protein